MVSKSINSDTTSTSSHCSLFCNAVVYFVLVIMIYLHTLWNNTYMSHIDKPMNSHVFFVLTADAHTLSVHR